MGEGVFGRKYLPDAKLYVLQYSAKVCFTFQKILQIYLTQMKYIYNGYKDQSYIDRFKVRQKLE